MPLFTRQQCTEARHLLRAILRESTYLPDPQARTYIAVHAVARFRDYTPGNKPDDLLLQRRRQQLDNARKALSELRRANEGELKPLIKVLHLTYARIGKRRHEILSSLQHKPPADANVDDKTLPRITLQHRALLESQRQTSPPAITRPLLRSWTLKIPETNSWDRPMPKKRVANITREWYAKILERTIVPLPRSEWERLRDLALGNTKFKGPIPRRTALASTSALPSPLELSLGLVPVNSPRVILHKAANPVHGHRLTPRFMQRCWASVFAHCPVMSWDTKSQKWSVEWGCNVLNKQKILRAAKDTTVE